MDEFKENPNWTLDHFMMISAKDTQFDFHETRGKRMHSKCVSNVSDDLQVIKGFNENWSIASIRILD